MHELPDDARQYVNMSLRDMAAESLAREGVSTRGMSADEVFTRAAHTSSDFPLVVSNAANKVALDTYKAAESPLKILCRQRTLPPIALRFSMERLPGCTPALILPWRSSRMPRPTRMSMSCSRTTPLR